MSSIAESLQVAVTAHQAGDLPKAETIYHEIIRIDPQHADALHLLGVVANARNQHSDAVGFISRAIESNGGFAPYYGNLGIACLKLGNREQALQCFQKALELDPSFADAYFNLGTLHFDISNWDQATECFQRGLAIDDDDASSWQYLGLIHEKQERFDRAIECYEQVLRLDPGCADTRDDIVRAGNRGRRQPLQQPSATPSHSTAPPPLELNPPPVPDADDFVRRADALISSGRIDEAIDAYRAALGMNPDHAEAHLGIGGALKSKQNPPELRQQFRSTEMHSDSYQELGSRFGPMSTVSKTFQTAVEHHRTGQRAQATQIAEEILRVDPGHAGSLNLLGVTALSENQHDQAVQFLTRAVAADSNDPFLYANLGKAFQNLGENERAIDAFQTAIRLLPEFFDAHFHLAGALQAAGRQVEAVDAFRNAIRLRPNDTGVYRELGKTLWELGEREGAVACFQSALVLNPDDIEALCHLGTTWQACGDWHASITPLEKAARLRPDDSRIACRLGKTYAQLKRTDDAVRSFGSAIEHDPRCAEAYFRLGSILSERGEYGAARNCFETCIAIEPDDDQARAALGMVRLHQKEPEAALVVLQEAVRRKPNSAEALCCLGHALRELQRFDEAIDAYQLSITIVPDSPAARYLFAKTLHTVGRLEEAVEQFREAARLSPESPHVLFHMGNALKNLGRLPEAADAFRGALERQPEFVDARYQLGNVFRRQRDYESARACYEDVLRQRPDDPPTLISLGNVLKSLDELDGAAAAYRKALKMVPEQNRWQLWIATLCPAVFDSSDAIDEYRANLLAELERLAETGVSFEAAEIGNSGCPAPYLLQFHGRDDRPLKEAYARVFRDGLPHIEMKRNTGKPSVGVVVTDGHEGVFLRFCGGILQRFDPELFDVTVVCSTEAEQRIRSTLAVKSIRTLPITSRFDQTLNAIHDAAFDVIYHWEVGSDVTNYFLPFFRLAPVQFTSCGVPVTTGIPNMDYFLSSAAVEGPDADAHYSERLIRAETLLTCQPRLKLPAPPKTRRHFGFSSSRHVYLCPHKIEKFHPDLDGLFGEILQRDPSGLLVIPSDRHGHKGRKLLARLERRLPDVADRICLLPHQTLPDYLSLTAAADVVLDPLYYGGGLTAYDGLSLNKAIVTLPTQFVRGRYTAGFYETIGVTECIAATKEDYVDIAIRLGTRPDLRKATEARIAEASNVLFDNRDSDSRRKRFRTMSDRPTTMTDAVALHRAANYAAAENAYREILRREPAHADAQHLLGVALLQTGRHEAAFNAIQTAITRAGDRPDYFSNLAEAALAAGKLDEAAAALQTLVRLRPGDAVAWFRLGNAEKSRHHHDEATTAYRRAVALSPELAEAHFNLANTLRDRSRFDEAEDEYRIAVELLPGFAAGWNNLGTLLLGQDRLDEARDCFETATSVEPQSADGWNNLGIVLRELDNLDGAIAAFRRCLLVDSEHRGARCNLARAEQSAGRLDAAEAGFRNVIAGDPDHFHAHNSLGTVLFDMGRCDEAIRCFDRALEIESGEPRARCNRALARLLGGDDAPGWAEYEARWERPDHQRPRFPQPLWDGSPLAGRTILLDWEQGLGDTLQFVRFAKTVQQQQGVVIVRCQKPLARLLNSAPGIDRVVTDDMALPEFDVHAPLMSLPYLLKLRIESLPDSVPYIAPEPRLFSEWQNRLADVDGMRIGICWRGNAGNHRDRFRSFDLDEFEPLAAIPGVRLISLQKGKREPQDADAASRLSLIDLGDELDGHHGPFMDTAAIMRNLDLVVTADTAIAHLAGALGVPVCVALCRLSEWRWMLDRDDSPWYPTLRLYRQRKLGCWNEVFQQIADDIRGLLDHLAATAPAEQRTPATCHPS
eukprot:g32978.t1